MAGAAQDGGYVVVGGISTVGQPQSPTRVKLGSPEKLLSMDSRYDGEYLVPMSSSSSVALFLRKKGASRCVHLGENKKRPPCPPPKTSTCCITGVKAAVFIAVRLTASANMPSMVQYVHRRNVPLNDSEALAAG